MTPPMTVPHHSEPARKAVAWTATKELNRNDYHGSKPSVVEYRVSGTPYKIEQNYRVGGSWSAYRGSTKLADCVPFDDAKKAVNDDAAKIVAAFSPAATSAETQGAVELLRKLEEACDNAAGKRSQATYDQMISDPGAEDALEELDIARREARIFLNPDLWRRANGER